ncbi:MAG: hypothetical protein KKB70_08085 [Proteobacteria bacterium]|nr:hypothetical protein [Pseudomonadota bacterium]
MSNKRILITGMGSGVGQGIVKALRMSALDLTLVGADISHLHSGMFRVDEALLIPKVEDEGSLERMLGILRDARIDMVMVGSEFDLAFFSEHRALIERETGALVAASPPEVIAVSNDKRCTADFLRDQGLPYAAWTAPASTTEALRDAESLGYPVILKDAEGTSSRHVHVLEKPGELAAVFESVPNAMLQQLIGMPSNDLHSEFTCSVFKGADGELVGPFTARRTLRGGSSWIVEVLPVPELDELLLAIGRNLPVLGSLNVQLMLGTEGPVPFEFNARPSGTTAVRAHYGFNEPEMTVRSYLLGQSLPRPVIGQGLAFRYLEEVFVDNATACSAERFFGKGTVRRWY